MFSTKQVNPKLLSPLTLAFIGDAVYELLVRERIVQEGNMPVNAMHNKTVAKVKASAQSEVFEKLLPYLSEDQTAILKRGRNAHSNTSPKHAELSDYRRATGVEALYGYLYLKGEKQRIEEIFSITYNQLSVD